jgi:tetratricopeptide (TPR) repeat protein
MRTLLWTSAVLLASSLLFAPARALADDSPEEALFRKVMDRLLSSDLVKRAYPTKYAWPPKAFVKKGSPREINAYASAYKGHGATVDEKTGKLRPVVMATEGILKQVVKGDENSLAVIMGHELAHLARDHVAGRKGETPLLFLAFSRDQEIDADLEGLRYAVAAGYPYRTGVAAAIRAMRERTRHTSFEGLGSTHPTWEDRLALLDREQAKLWSAMSAFQNGFLFLALEQYPAAQQCFRAVVAEFPDCHEVWANLGYAQLMRYCDGLESDDVRNYGIGQIVAGGFYARPQSLESKVRGIDEKMWRDAVKALNKALTLQPDLALPRANLGLAYLVHPEGKNARLARKWLRDALEHVKKDPELGKSPLALGSLLINAGVADLAGGDTKEAAAKLGAAAKVLQALRVTPLTRSLEDALLYNQALLEARSPEGRKKACELLEEYLELASPDSAWWPLAFDRYAALAKELGRPARPRADLARRYGPASLRMVTSVTVGRGAIALSNPVQESVELLGKDAGVAAPLFPGSKIVRWRFAERGIDLLARDKVLAIFLTRPEAPPVVVQARGAAGKTRQLRVGMAEKEAREVLQGHRADKGLRVIIDPKLGYQLFPEVGLAIRFADGRVEELAIAQVPRVSFAEK